MLRFTQRVKRNVTRDALKRRSQTLRLCDFLRAQIAERGLSIAEAARRVSANAFLDRLRLGRGDARNGRALR
jgi:hypothetical protein